MDNTIKKLLIEYLMSTPAGVGLQKAVESIQSAQQFLYALQEKSDDKGAVTIKVGTTLTLALLTKLATSGKTIQDFTKNDWLDIANSVAKYSILLDDSKYSVFVFMLYARYIDLSLELVQGKIPEKSYQSISDLSARLYSNAQLFGQDEIDEVQYIEDCLWICLEAMVKLLASYPNVILKISSESTDEKEISENSIVAANLAEAVTIFGFEYGRYKLLKREQSILQEYLDYQDNLDLELDAKLNEYTETLSKESDYFNNLVENAFSTDIRNAFFGSADLAKEVGVKSSEIIDSEQKIDDYFLSDTDSVSPLSDATFDPGANALDEETHTARKGHKKSVMNIFNRHKENYYAIVCSEDDEFSFITHAADILSKHGYQIFWHIAAGTKMQYVRCFEDELSDVEKCLSLIPEVSILHKPLSKFSVRRFLK